MNVYKHQDFVLNMVNLDAWKTSRGEVEEIVTHMHEEILVGDMKSHGIKYDHRR